MIMKGRAPLRLPLAGLLALVLTAAVTLPAFATDSSQQTPPPPPLWRSRPGVSAEWRECWLTSLPLPLRCG